MPEDSASANRTPPPPQGPTVEATKPAADSTPPLLAGRGPRSDDVAPLLRKRLLFIALMFLGALVIYLRNILGQASAPRLLAFAAIAFSLVSCLAWRLWRWPATERGLRRMELALFLTVAAFVTVGQLNFLSAGWLETLGQHDRQGVRLLARSISLSWVSVIIGYGLLVPNAWRRCLAVVGALAAWPPLVFFVATLADEAVGLGLRITFALEVAVCTGLAALGAAYGSHRIETLRELASPNRRLGPYQLRSKLGAGGMGEVWLAEHVLLRRPCAVKLIRAEKVGQQQFLRRFEREVKATAALSHPNTVAVYDYGTADDGTFYYAMEYLPGSNLDELVRACGPLPPARAVHLLRQLCGALEEAHGVGLVHRDVKPGNVLVCDRGGVRDVAKLLDFGLVRIVEASEGETLTEAGMVAGTPQFMSPEQARGDPADRRSDLYSLGAVAYFLLTGLPPFLCKTDLQTLQAHQTRPPVPPATDADLRDVVLRCLEKDAARRYASAAELERALAACSCASKRDSA